VGNHHRRGLPARPHLRHGRRPDPPHPRIALRMPRDGTWRPVCRSPVGEDAGHLQCAPMGGGRDRCTAADRRRTACLPAKPARRRSPRLKRRPQPARTGTHSRHRSASREATAPGYLVADLARAAGVLGRLPDNLPLSGKVTPDRTARVGRLYPACTARFPVIWRTRYSPRAVRIFSVDYLGSEEDRRRILPLCPLVRGE
jgi:hypothetical protein